MTITFLGDNRPKDHMVCFECRKSFKQVHYWHLDNHWDDALAWHRRGVGHCPECGGPLFPAGRGFKAPRKEAIGQWEKVRQLMLAGETFPSTYIPKGHKPRRGIRTVREGKEYVKYVRAKPKSTGESLLRKFERYKLST